MDIYQLSQYLASFMAYDRFQDYAPNGLQIEGKQEVKKIVTGVSICQPLIDKAIAVNADLILVHHGFFWKNENPCLTGVKKSRIKLLLEHQLNLIGIHIPLDVHKNVGNNVQLAKRLGIKITDVLEPFQFGGIGCVGTLSSSMLVPDFTEFLNKSLNTQVMHIPGHTKELKTIAWCTGAAQNLFQAAIDRRVDAYITGEISEPITHLAQESGVHFFAAGHHATERYGIAALGEHLNKEFSLQHEFIDIPNTV